MAANRISTRQQVNVLGVRVDAISLEDLFALVTQFAHDGEKHRVMYANVHVLNTAARDAGLRRILNRADIVYCDGSGVRLGARLLGGRLPPRMTGADWIYPACERWGRDGLSIFLLGGRPGVANRAADKLRQLHPALKIAGTHAGFITDHAPAVAAINSARPDVLLVGMGTPTQEHWVAANFESLAVPVVWVVGALFDFVSGDAPRAPRWMLDNNLEWLGRLLAEPGRLWMRYLIGNPLFLWRVMMQRLNMRRFEDSSP